MLYRSLVEALYTLNSPPVVSFNEGRSGVWTLKVLSLGLLRFKVQGFGVSVSRVYGSGSVSLESFLPINWAYFLGGDVIRNKKPSVHLPRNSILHPSVHEAGC